MFINKLFSLLGYKIVKKDCLPSKRLLKELPLPKDDPAIEEEFKTIRERILSYPTKSKFKLDGIEDYTIYSAIKYITENNILGDIVECGVLSGSKIMIVLQYLMEHKITDRDIYLYDTFSGMTEPSDKDRKFSNEKSSNKKLFEVWNQKNKGAYNEWGYIPLDEVKANIEVVGYPEDKIHYIKGDVCETLLNAHHNDIAILRLDTDFYASSKQELESLYGDVVKGGVTIFDDYGGFEGQKIATDEFFKANHISPFLHRTCRQERVLIK